MEEEHSTVKPNIQDTVSRRSVNDVKYSKVINRRSLRQGGQQGNLPNLNNSMLGASALKSKNVFQNTTKSDFF